MTEVLERVLADKLGIDRRVLLEKRKNGAPADGWRKTAQGIVWTDEGCRWLNTNLAREGSGVAGRGDSPSDTAGEALGVAPSRPGGESDMNGVTEKRIHPPSWHPVICDLVVKVIYKKNSRLLGAVNEAGELQRVRVKTNANFVPGMVIPCIHQQADLWTLNGKCPKRRGKFIPKKEVRP